MQKTGVKSNLSLLYNCCILLIIISTACLKPFIVYFKHWFNHCTCSITLATLLNKLFYVKKCLSSL